MDLKPLIILFSLLIISNSPCKANNTNCSISKCGDSSGNLPDIRFPFWVKTPGQQPDSCGRAGFEVWCDERSKHTLIKLPKSGNFWVKSIDYAAQEMWVNDPNKCLPKKLLTFNNILDESPFGEVYHQDFSFFNCSNTFDYSTIKNYTHYLEGSIVGPIKCLSGSHHFIYAMPSNGTNHTNTTSNFYSNIILSPLNNNCSVIAPSVKVPVQWPPSLHKNTNISLLSDLHGDLRLSWYMPECRPCELNGQMCALENDSNSSEVIICSNIPNKGMVGKLPLTTFIAVILVICAPSIICVVYTVIIWIRHCYRRNRSRTSNLNLEAESLDSNGPHHEQLGQLAEVNIEFARYLVRMGLNEEANLDRRPTVVISEIEEVGQGGPNRENENECAICMGEYRRKDRIGTLPSCEHHFHANCINKWLLSRGRFGKTCPICRAPVDSS